MQGRAFLDVARRLAAETAEADWRAAAGRAYYALMLEGRETLRRWGFQTPRRDQVHAFTRLRFVYASDSQLKNVGYALERLLSLRNYADYQLEKPGQFASPTAAAAAVTDAETHVIALDRIDVDPARRAAAIADIRARWP